MYNAIEQFDLVHQHESKPKNLPIAQRSKPMERMRQLLSADPESTTHCGCHQIRGHHQTHCGRIAAEQSISQELQCRCGNIPRKQSEDIQEVL